jgi:acetyl-CoA carboxylase carboxyl transferase subunit beta
MSWLKKAIPPKIKNILGKVKKNIPEGLWQKCPSCQTVLYGTDLEKNNYVCPNCDFHHRINSRKRISLLLDTPDQIELGKILSLLIHYLSRIQNPIKTELNHLKNKQMRMMH